MGKLAGDLSLELRCIKLPFFSTSYSYFHYHSLGELRVEVGQQAQPFYGGCAFWVSVRLGLGLGLGLVLGVGLAFLVHLGFGLEVGFGLGFGLGPIPDLMPN